MTKSQRLRIKQQGKREAAYKSIPAFAKNALPKKQSLSRSSVYTGGDCVTVVNSKGVETMIPSSVASMPKYGRTRSDSRFDQRTDNRKFNSQVASVITDAEAIRVSPDKRDEVRTTLETVVSLLFAATDGTFKG